jgi:hypothetical protein
MRVVSDVVQLHLLNDGAWWEVRLAQVAAGYRWASLPSGRRVRHEVGEPYVDVVLRAELSDLPAKKRLGLSY